MKYDQTVYMDPAPATLEPGQTLQYTKKGSKVIQQQRPTHLARLVPLWIVPDVAKYHNYALINWSCVKA